MKKPLLVLALALAASLTTLSASADDSVGRDEVVLKNGGTIRGTVLSVEPGTKVVILEMGSKAPRTLTWPEVADVQKNRYPADESGKKVEPGAGGPGYTSPPPAGEEPAQGRGVVKVHIESKKPVKLIEHMGTSVAAGGGYVIAIEQLRVACASPCDKVVDGSRGQEFAIVGDGVPVSKPFTLNERDRATQVDVDPGSNGLQIGGSYMAIFGGTGVLGGALLLPLGFALSRPDSDMSGMKIAGGVMLGTGTALLAGGIVMIVSGKTHVDVHEAGMKTAKAAPKPRYWAGEF